jgi:hypothetical protein
LGTRDTERKEKYICDTSLDGSDGMLVQRRKGHLEPGHDRWGNGGWEHSVKGTYLGNLTS